MTQMEGHIRLLAGAEATRSSWSNRNEPSRSIDTEAEGVPVRDTMELLAPEQLYRESRQFWISKSFVESTNCKI